MGLTACGCVDVCICVFLPVSIVLTNVNQINCTNRQQKAKEREMVWECLCVLPLDFLVTLVVDKCVDKSKLCLLSLLFVCKQQQGAETPKQLQTNDPNEVLTCHP